MKRSRSSFLPPLGIQLAFLLIAIFLTAFFEWSRYRHFFHWRRSHLEFSDRCILFWLICAKSMWVLLPLLLVVGLLYRFGLRRCGGVLAMMGVALVSCWLVADLRVLQVTGNHMLDYLGYVGDAEAQEWAGNATLIDGRTVLHLTLIAVGSALMVFLGQRTATRLDERKLRRVAAAVLFILAFGVLFTGSCLSNPLLIEQLERNLPVQFGWFDSTGSAAGGLSEFRRELDSSMKEPVAQLMPRVLEGQPLDTEARIDHPKPPNVVIIVLESFRHNAITPENMPRVSKWAKQARRFERHYTGSNCSQYGIFSLLYGRVPFVYDFTIDAGVLPQLPATFRNSGYRCSYVSSGTLDHIRMKEFITPQSFDEMCLHLRGWWVKRDRAAFKDMARILREHTDKPQMIFSFMMSTHYPYRWGKEHDKYHPIIEDWVLTDPKLSSQRDKFMNRYRNALAFMDDQIADLIEPLDLSKNIVVITGDHGESFWEDSRFTHCSRLSDIQSCVPLIIAGPGITPGSVRSVTQHADVLPTILHAAAGHTVPLARTHGKDTLVEGFHNDETVLFPYIGRNSIRTRGHGDLVLLKADKRLRLRVYFDQRGIKTDSFYDERDDLDTRDTPTADDAEFWGRRLLEDLERFGTR